jgi:hypothetical protein
MIAETHPAFDNNHKLLELGMSSARCPGKGLHRFSSVTNAQSGHGKAIGGLVTRPLISTGCLRNGETTQVTQRNRTDCRKAGRIAQILAVPVKRL